MSEIQKVLHLIRGEGGGTLGSDMTLNSKGRFSQTRAALCLLVPQAHTEVRAKDQNLIRSFYKKW